MSHYINNGSSFQGDISIIMSTEVENATGVVVHNEVTLLFLTKTQTSTISATLGSQTRMRDPQRERERERER